MILHLPRHTKNSAKPLHFIGVLDLLIVLFLHEYIIRISRYHKTPTSIYACGGYSLSEIPGTLGFLRSPAITSKQYITRFC